MKGYEFSVLFQVENEEEAEAVVDAVLLAVCGGKKWKHRRPWRWLDNIPGVNRVLNICPRFFFGSGPYEIDEDGEPRTEARRTFGYPPPAVHFPSFWSSNANTGNAWTYSRPAPPREQESE